MSGAKHRQKGDRAEREIVERHQAIGIHAERYPLSGASRFRGSGHEAFQCGYRRRFIVPPMTFGPSSRQTPAADNIAVLQRTLGLIMNRCAKVLDFVEESQCSCVGAQPCRRRPRCFRD